eukprot:TRINITY_DN25646_c1_g1_i7.p1 TRINITY_DN25646_c1_g1~~TRINITY_DN25646_c1_g1_i7.p1  ORF type:complete len:422 (-),score=70.03 TRINITY_DN25646_c1_g1_i7:541-1806(-)
MHLIVARVQNLTVKSKFQVNCQSQEIQKNILILGGTGRVGSSTATALKQFLPGSRIVLSGRNQFKYQQVIQEKPQLNECSFQLCDIDNVQQLQDVMSAGEYDIVVHAAGPFQRKDNYHAIEAAINNKITYLDVCDDSEYAQHLKQTYHNQAVQQGVGCITTGGIYPGVSNVMAQQMIQQGIKSDPEMKAQKLQYNYYTAGSGGVGPTILETSFLLAGEPAVVYEDGQRMQKPPVSDRKNKDFGKGVGIRSTYLYNLPEVITSFQELGIPNISARFGTTPEIWNIGMALLPVLVPKHLLADRDWVRRFGKLVGGLVAATDVIVGEKVAMLVEIDYENGKNTCGLYVHDKLSSCVGNCVAAFAMDMLENKTEAGVHFPESDKAIADAHKFFERATLGCYRYILNKPKWFLDTDPQKMGMGLYI